MSTADSNSPLPINLKSDTDSLIIEWDDGVTQSIRWERLRDHCPCATCRTKRAEPTQLLPVINVIDAQPIRPTSMTPMGNYAYNIAFNDGHNTGIYSLEFLRNIRDEEIE